MENEVADTTWLWSMIRNKKAIFLAGEKKLTEDGVVLEVIIARNRAARRILQSSAVRKVARANGNTIDGSVLF